MYLTRWIVIYERDYTWHAEFKWQVLDEYDMWIDVSDSISTEKCIIDSFINQGGEHGNKVAWTFSNPTYPIKKYKSWRVYGVSGKATCGWIRLLFMNLR